MQDGDYGVCSEKQVQQLQLKKYVCEDMSVRPLLSLEHQCTYEPTFLDDKDSTLEQIQCLIYPASQALLLGTESRVISMVLFHRYYARYIHQWLLYTLGYGNNSCDGNSKLKCPNYHSNTCSSSDRQQEQQKKEAISARLKESLSRKF